MITKVFTSIVRSSLTVLGLLAVLFSMNWKLTIVTLILIPIIAVVVNLTGKRLKKLNQQSLVINGQLTQVIEETTRAQQVIKIFGGENYEKGRLEQRAEDLRGYTMRMTRTFAATVPATGAQRHQSARQTGRNDCLRRHVRRRQVDAGQSGTRVLFGQQRPDFAGRSADR